MTIYFNSYLGEDAPADWHDAIRAARAAASIGLTDCMPTLQQLRDRADAQGATDAVREIGREIAVLAGE